MQSRDPRSSVIGESIRSVDIGSTCVARTAGAHTEINATMIKSSGVAKNAMGSRGCTPNRKLSIG